MKKAIPTGISDYQRLRCDDYYIVDKTLMIQEFLERKSQVTLITRPRRFGKTSNMSMMKEFFDITKDSKKIFEGTNVMNTEYAKEMNQYPTIFISFANCKGNYELLIDKLFIQLQKAFEPYLSFFDNSDLNEGLKSRVKRVYRALDERNNIFEIASSLNTLSELLHAIYHKKTMIIIDEYDTPFIEAHLNEYYHEIRNILASLLHDALKDNPYLQYAMLTGIQRVAKENIFSDLNNLKVFTVGDEAYASYFGFTETETKTLLDYYDTIFDDNVKAMYDGYTIGNMEIYNPWSIINYAAEKKLVPYWVNTSSNKMIKNAIKQSDISFKEGYETLIMHDSLDTQVNMETSFYEQADTSNLWGLFVNAGYLTIEETLDLENKEFKIRIPNKEVVSEFKDLTADYLHVATKDLTDLYKSILRNDMTMFLKSYERLLLVNPSYHDLIRENSYHMFLLGICLYIKNDYDIISNREEGKGRCDIIFKAKKTIYPSYAIELKFTKDEEADLQVLAKEALMQITEQQYGCEVKGKLIHVGLAHCGKKVALESREI